MDSNVKYDEVKIITKYRTDPNIKKFRYTVKKNKRVFTTPPRHTRHLPDPVCLEEVCLQRLQNVASRLHGNEKNDINEGNVSKWVDKDIEMLLKMDDTTLENYILSYGNLTK